MGGLIGGGGGGGGKGCVAPHPLQNYWEATSLFLRLCTNLYFNLFSDWTAVIQLTILLETIYTCDIKEPHCTALEWSIL